MNAPRHFDIAGLIRVLLFVGVAWHCAILVEYWPRLNELAPFAAPKYPSRIFGLDLAAWPWLQQSAPLFLLTGALLGVLGVCLRLAALLTLAAMYLFFSNNNFGAQTSAQEGAMAMLIVMLALPWGGRSLTYKNPTWYSDRPQATLPHWLIAIYMLNALFAAAVAKMVKGHWLQDNFLGVLFATPPGLIMRAWWPAAAAELPPAVTYFASVTLILAQASAWMWFLLPKTRPIGFAIVAALQLAFFACISVPLLFLVVFVGGLALVVDWPALLRSGGGDKI